jgi:hypothetical protein
MQKQLFFVAFLLFGTTLSAQTIQEIATGTGYQKQSFVNLSAGTEKLVNNTDWDIAFTVFGQQDAGIFINESSGSSMGQPLPATTLLDALTTDWTAELLPDLIEYPWLLNSEYSWNEGAFNAVRDSANALDYGWGQYNPGTFSVVGDAVYIVVLRNGEYRKLQIQSLIGSTYTFRYANLDGTNEQVRTINKADHSGKLLAYFNLTTGQTVDVEPATGGFDLLYCRYVTRLLDPSTGQFIPYILTGILTNRGSDVAEADGVNPATVQYADYVDSLRPNLDVIGHDWKAFNNTWSVDEDRVFFLRTAADRVWKLHFIDFEGSSTGKAILEKTDLGIISSVQDPAAAGIKVATYPNPVQDELTIALDLPARLASAAQVQVVDVQGRLVAQRSVVLTEGFQVIQLPAATWAAGTHWLRLLLPSGEIKLAQIVKI